MPNRRRELRPAVIEAYPDKAAAIASIIATWNITEGGLFMLLSILLKSHPSHATALLSKIATSQGRLDVIRSVGARELASDELLLREFRKVMDSISARLKARNQYARGLYVVNSRDQLCILNRGYDIPLQSKDIQILYKPALDLELNRAVSAMRKLAVFMKRLMRRVHSEVNEGLRQIWYDANPINQFGIV
jgi:hypothetical protein